jgi:hypothetical protein
MIAIYRFMKKEEIKSIKKSYTFLENRNINKLNIKNWRDLTKALTYENF